MTHSFLDDLALAAARHKHADAVDRPGGMNRFNLSDMPDARHEQGSDDRSDASMQMHAQRHADGRDVHQSGLPALESHPSGGPSMPMPPLASMMRPDDSPSPMTPLPMPEQGGGQTQPPGQQQVSTPQATQGQPGGPPPSSTPPPSGPTPAPPTSPGTPLGAPTPAAQPPKMAALIQQGPSAPAEVLGNPPPMQAPAALTTTSNRPVPAPPPPAVQPPQKKADFPMMGAFGFGPFGGPPDPLMMMGMHGMAAGAPPQTGEGMQDNYRKTREQVLNLAGQLDPQTGKPYKQVEIDRMMNSLKADTSRALENRRSVKKTYKEAKDVALIKKAFGYCYGPMMHQPHPQMGLPFGRNPYGYPQGGFNNAAHLNPYYGFRPGVGQMGMGMPYGIGMGGMGMGMPGMHPGMMGMGMPYGAGMGGYPSNLNDSFGLERRARAAPTGPAVPTRSASGRRSCVAGVRASSVTPRRAPARR